MVETRSNGVGVWWVSRRVALFNCCRSTVRLGSPFFLAVTTIRAHHSVDVPCGTFSIMPKRTSLSRSSLTRSFQWWGTGIGVWTAYGLQSFLNSTFIGSPVICGRGWWAHWLNADDSKVFSNQSFSFGMLLSIGSNGIAVGLGGVGVRGMHGHD